MLMATRLNAEKAASLTEQRAKEIEASSKLDDEIKKLKKAQIAKQVRLWKAQGNRLLEAALNGQSFLRVGQQLVEGDKLIKLGFSIAYVDQVSFLEHQNDLNIERINQKKTEERANYEIEKVRELEIKKLQLDVDKKTSDFILLIVKNDRYKGMESTQRMVAQRFQEEIKNYTGRISAGFSPRDKLFLKLFNSELFVYKPIDSFKPIVQSLQDSLHKLEKFRLELPEIPDSEFDEFDEYDANCDEIDDEEEEEEEEEEEDLEIDEFKRYLDPWECSDNMLLDEPENYYQIEWGNLNNTNEWKFEHLIFAKSLSWLCGKSGQDLIEAIETEIQIAINSALSKIQISIEWDDEQSSCEFGGVIYYHTPTPNHLSDILKILKYKTQEHLVEHGKSLLEISW